MIEVFCARHDRWESDDDPCDAAPTRVRIDGREMTQSEFVRLIAAKEEVS